MNPDALRRFVRFLGSCIGVVVALLAIGFVPTRRLAGAEGPLAMLAGCSSGLVAASVAGWVIVSAVHREPSSQLYTALRAMMTRLAVVAVLGAVAALSGLFARTPLLFWIATSYVALLPLEVRLAIKS